MSAQFGRWNFDGAAAAPRYLARAREMLCPFGPDGGSSYSSRGVEVLYYALHTTAESRREIQPHVSASGAVVTWDGRLDNRAELVGLLHGSVSMLSPDVSIVASAYERWGTDSLAKLIGDWALAIWNPTEQSLLLAKDPIGTRHLCYSADRREVTWSTLLDPLVLLAGKNFEFDEEYVAGWLSCFPATHLTPYAGICAVPPSCFVQITECKRITQRYWDFDPGAVTRCRSDAEYEERFRFAFAQSVKRRLRSGHPVLAELSGGMDSSSIVSVADSILKEEGNHFPRLDTLSFFDDSEPNWNERPFFARVEEARGREGFHIDLGPQRRSVAGLEATRFAAQPSDLPNRVSHELARYVESGGYRVILSGIGGDEVMGGVPTPHPELADLLARARFQMLARQLRTWALEKRKPWFHLLFETARGFLPAVVAGVPKAFEPAAWVTRSFLKRHRAALTGYPARLKVFGPLPSFQENLITIEALRRQLSCSADHSGPAYERRFPYLDRSLLEFLCGLPREQLVRPGQRRSLMRRALSGIVPNEILQRKRKAYSARSPAIRIADDWARLAETGCETASAALGIIDAVAASGAAEAARRGGEIPLVLLRRTITLELWLRNIREHGIVAAADSMAPPGSTDLLAQEPRGFLKQFS